MNSIIKKSTWFEIAPLSLKREDYRFYLFLNYVYIFAFSGHLLFLYPLYAMLNYRIAFISDILCLFADVFCFILLRRGKVNVSLVLFLVAVSAHTAMAIIVFGGTSSLSMFYLSMLALTFFSHWKILYKMIAAVLLISLSAGLTVYSLCFSPVTEITRIQLVFWNFGNITVNSFAVAYGIYYFSFIVNTAEEKLRFQAEHDLLTGILNRNTIVKILVSNIAKNQNQIIAIVMTDIDHFKRINDRHGHLVGDEVLKAVTRILGISLREADSLGRFGGEEFIMVLPGCHLSKALGVAERIRRLVADTPVSTSAGDIKVSMSFGVAVMQSGWGEDSEALINRADRALYSAKNNGRNRVEYA